MPGILEKSILKFFGKNEMEPKLILLVWDVCLYVEVLNKFEVNSLFCIFENFFNLYLNKCNSYAGHMPECQILLNN